MPLTRWAESRSSDLAAAAGPERVAVLPVGAVEQHGPHLPLGTDTMLAEVMATRIAERTRVAEVVLLPAQSIGASEEHHDFPGTIVLEPELLIATLLAVGRSVATAGIGKLVFLNAHGGNVPALQIACRRLRVRHDLFALAAGWMALGVPERGPGEDRGDDVHAGFLETAAMLHLRPDLVNMDRAENFVSTARAVAESNEALRLLGPITTGWTARDLHPSGAAGNAAAATAEAGRRIVEHAAARYALLLDEVAAHAPPWRAAP